ncbi:hypothetical protein ACOMHN_050980 [Nucella lapillus]
MRPDEHKKKKSAQYQKKHAGSSAGKGDKNENDKSSSKSRKQQGSSKNEASERSRRPHADPKTRTDLNVSSTSESEEDGGERESHRKDFRRREITSNWAKYDLPTVPDGDDAPTAPRGQDFSKLLQSAGSAMAHFRFKDEESWEDDGGSAGGPGAQVLSLDCAQLATSMSCLPLYTQLGLNTDIFTAEQLTAMKTTAEENRQMAGLPAPDPETDENSRTSPSPRSAKPSTPATPLPSHLSESLESRVPSAPSPVLVKKGEKGAASDPSTDRNQGTALETDYHVATSSSDPSASAGLTDADLDSLLAGGDDHDHDSHSHENHTARPAKVKVGPSEVKVGSPEVKVGSSEGQRACSGKASGVEGEEEGVTEQDLDDLLALDVPQSSQSPAAAKAGPRVNESKMAAESAELEDWLDSVLDD